MLPDFPDLKKKLARRIRARMKAVHASHTAPLSAAGMIHIPEGDRVMSIDEDGLESEIPMKQHRVTVTITDDEVETLTTEEMIRRFDNAAQQMATQTGKTFIESLDRSVQSVRNVVNYHGKITADDLFAMYEKVQIDFDEQGRPELPTLVCGKKMYSELTDLLPELDDNPAMRERLAQIIERKREEWRDRESSRKLVG